MTLEMMRTRNGSSKNYILAHKWTNNDLELQVEGMARDVTWEPLGSCKDLEALDVYLELQGAKAP